MITAENRDSFLEAHFEADKKCDGLHGVVAAIDIITHEKVVGIGRTTTDLKEFH